MSVDQTGTITPGHVAVWTTDGVIQDGGAAPEPAATSFAILSDQQTALTIQNNLISTGGFSQLSLGITEEAAILTVQNYGTESPLPLLFVLNGVTSTLGAFGPMSEWYTGAGMNGGTITNGQTASVANLTGDVTSVNTEGTIETTVTAVGGKGVSLGGPLATGGSVTVSGAYNLLLGITGDTTLTLPTTGTLLANALASADIWVGNSSGFAQARAMSGDATISNTGAVAVGSIGGKAVSLGGAVTVSGAHPVTLVATGTTDITLPTAGTLLSSAALGDFLAFNNGSLISNSQITVAATATGTFAITPTLGVTNALVNGPASGGTITLHAGAANGPDQRMVLNIQQGATAATWHLTTGFNFGTTYPSFTATATAAARDVLTLIANDGTLFDVVGIAQGFTV
jgi:hypothetical protein